MSYLQTSATSHARKVRSLYKQAVRLLQAHYEGYDRFEFRYQAVLMRARFDEHKEEIDVRKAKKLLLDGQKELFLKSHPQPIKFPLSPGGVAYQRTYPAPDWLLDFWSSHEKAQYPEYFALRDIRKKEFIERWEKQYGKSDSEVSH
ncbi:NADH dehydrogenase [ubiquinone] 1 beta subcomplex subunit 9-like [Physella acuta]|uniref:NADH dehydrogenase [ubiquinone] 1 beta subcomplex subunit 9-like n=1 Tax=Physella acuta TaxID=109671 RepID=UPI0027DD12FA|nr:NADH dehydrogenase [ubiquinone] 1 beta subcomplex subunit 9-like [Physella acuta]XP_059164404.1 NADH dehydrogenase [ubiquinone] 1 beta subcomplex subunit 9-like [Physella acuta]